MNLIAVHIRRLFHGLSLLIFGFVFKRFLKNIVNTNQHKEILASKFKENNSFFYLINDLNVAKSILDESNVPNGYFISQLKQPYLLVDSTCKFKITQKEYTNIINIFVLKCFQKTRQEFIDVIYVNEFKKFLDAKNFNFIKIKKIFKLAFKISNVYIKNLFNDEQLMIDNSSSLNQNEEEIFRQLLNLQKNFKLNLFTDQNNNSNNEYTSALTNFLILVENEYCDTSNDCATNSKHIKFLFIKNFFLDLLLVNSIISNFLYDLSKLNSNSISSKMILNSIRESQTNKSLHLKSNEVWKCFHLKELVKAYFVKYLATDLLTINLNSQSISKSRFNIFHENCLIGLNFHGILYKKRIFESLEQRSFENLIKLFNLNKFYFDSNNLILNLAICMCYSILKNFDLKSLECFNNQDENSKDVKLIPFFTNIRIKLNH